MSTESDKKDRLASALRANLARRKAQGRARAAQDADGAPREKPALLEVTPDGRGGEAAPDAPSPVAPRIVPGDGEG